MREVLLRIPLCVSSALKYEKLVGIILPMAILAVALVLRLYGLDWDRGYDYSPHPDERAILMKVGELSPPSLTQLGDVINADESPWNPRWFPYGSFPLYLLKGVQLLYSAVSGTELEDLRIPGRIISALADVGTVAGIYVLGCHIYGRREAILGSAFVAIAVLHIQLSHFYTVDTLLGLCAVSALYFMCRVAKGGRKSDSILAGVFVGLGIATKVSMAPVYLALIMAHVLFILAPNLNRCREGVEKSSRLKRASKGLISAVTASVLVLAAVQPYTFLDWSRFLGDVVEQAEMVRRIRDYPYTRQYIDTIPYWYHVRQLSTWGLGWFLGLLAWSGLLYVSVRGMRYKIALGYLGLGWALPMAILLVSSSFIAILMASGISFIALIATLPFRSVESRYDVLLLAWVAPFFLITGMFQVKFLRYLLPIIPFLLLFGSRVSVVCWDMVEARRPALRPWLAVCFVAILAGAAVYAISYMAIYSQPHTAVRAGQWLNEEAPKGSMILKEHWEEGLPGLEGYLVRDMPLYDPDGADKVRRISEDIAEAEYIVLYSNRLYGTIPRLPERYPLTTEYYHLLFSGRLGYDLVNVQAAYPRFAGIDIVNDTFGRPGLPRPNAVGSPSSTGHQIRMGFADESFSVYDHPLVLIFQNDGNMDASTIREMIKGAVPKVEAQGLTRSSYANINPDVQRRGGTWKDIVKTESWSNRFPALAWLMAIEIAALLMFPIAFVIFRPLSDRGFLLSKALGLLVAAFVPWLLASLHLVAFSRVSIWIGLTCVAITGTLIFIKRRIELLGFIRKRWLVLLVGEVIFLAAFFSFVLVRMGNPDLWHPFLGGEKPMEMAYLMAVLKSSFMPPYDPWFSGGYLNYYYWGYQMVATVIMATGIEIGVAFNLAVALFFALTVAGAYSIVYNLAEGTRQAVARYKLGHTFWSPIVAGVCAGLFVAVLGNLDGAIQVGQGIWRAVILGKSFGGFDFWRSSRMMPPDPPGHEITEFPFFTFLFADLHAHMMAIPYALLALGLALAVVLAAKGSRSGGRSWCVGWIVRVLTLGVVVGSLRVINTWDYPTYMILAIVAVFLAAYFRNGGLSLAVLLETAAVSAAIFAVGVIAFLPYHLAYQAPYGGLSTIMSVTSTQTALWQFLAIHGLFVFIVWTFIVAELRLWLVSSKERSASRTPADSIVPFGRAGLLIIGIIVGCAGTTIILVWGSNVMPFLVVMEVLVLVVAFRRLRFVSRDQRYLVFVIALVAVAVALAIGVDIFAVNGDRMNTVFKFYLQIWVLLSLAAAYLLWWMASTRGAPLRRPKFGARLWLVLLAALCVSSAIYPILGTRDRLQNRFGNPAMLMTLDGESYIRGAVYEDRKGQIDLEADYAGIKWLRANVEGSPVVLEASMPAEYHYRAWNGRVSVYTGLPSIVGWQIHQEQQRKGYSSDVLRRIWEVDRIYSTTDSSEAIRLMRKYGVAYVYLGQVERLYYPADGLKKFEGEMGDHLEAVYMSDKVIIYRVHEEVTKGVSGAHLQ